MRWKNLS